MKIGSQKFPNLERRRLAGGRIGWYWTPPPAAREAFTSSPLGDELDADALEKYAARQKALERWRGERRRVVEKIGARYGTIDWLIEDYQKTTHFTNLGEKSQADYRNKLLFLRDYRLDDGERLGSKPWAEIRGRHADVLYQRMCWRDDGTARPTYAGSVIRQARIVWNWAESFHEEEGTGYKNPWNAPKVKTPKPRQVKWEPDQVRRFIRKAAELGMVSVGIAAVLCYELGQRVGDARRLTRAAFEGKRVRIVQHKTGKELLLPVSDVLAEWIAKAPVDQFALIINEKTGRMYEDYELSKAAAIVRDAAELPSHLLLLDLRRTCLSEVGDLGATDDELVSISGHGDRQMLNIYSVRDYKRALTAMQRRWTERDAA